MFQLLPCSICQRTFSLRKEVPEHTLLKCPNCGNQFRLGDVLDAFYSPWIVLGESPAAQPDDGLTQGAVAQGALGIAPESHPTERPFSAPTDSKLSFDNLLHTHESSDANPLLSNAVTDDVTEVATDEVFEANDLNLGSADAFEAGGLDDAELVLDDSSTAAPEDELSAVEGNQFESPMENAAAANNNVKKMRPRRNDSGSLWSIIQVVLGGAAAIPVTLLLLWYVVGKDIMNAGPTVAQYVPWIVPKKFRTQSDEYVIQPSVRRAPLPASGDSGLPDLPSEAGADASMPSTNASNNTVTNEPKDDNASAEKSPSEKPDAAVVTAAASAESSGADAAMSQVVQAVNQAAKLTSQWDAKSPDKSTQAQELFNVLSSLSVQLSEVPADSGALRLLKDKLGNVGRTIAGNTELRLEVGTLILKQFSPEFAAESPGRLYLDWVREVKETETHWIIDNATEKYHLVIEVPKAVLPQLAKNQRFFCLATIEEPPTTDEAGAPKIIRASATFFKTL